jgi:hypothetical protein
LDYFAKAEKYSSLEELEKAVGKLVSGYLQTLSDRLIGRALTNETLKEFLAAIERVVVFYQTIDERIVNLYEDYLDKIPLLKETLDEILKFEEFENLGRLTGPEAWEIVRRLSGEKFYDLLLERTAFGDFLALVRQAKVFSTSRPRPRSEKSSPISKRSFRSTICSTSSPSSTRRKSSKRWPTKNCRDSPKNCSARPSTSSALSRTRPGS